MVQNLLFSEAFQRNFFVFRELVKPLFDSRLDFCLDLWEDGLSLCQNAVRKIQRCIEKRERLIQRTVAAEIRLICLIPCSNIAVRINSNQRSIITATNEHFNKTPMHTKYPA